MDIVMTLSSIGATFEHFQRLSFSEDTKCMPEMPAARFAFFIVCYCIIICDGPIYKDFISGSD